MKPIPIPCRFVTIGPVVLLAFLGVTFYLGANPTRRMIARRTANARSWLKPTEVDVPVMLNGSRARVICAENVVNSKVTVDTSEIQDRAPSDHPVEPVDLTPDFHDNWILGSGRDFETGAARDYEAPPRLMGRFIGVPNRSFRTIWKTGPGNNANKEQVGKWSRLESEVVEVRIAKLAPTSSPSYVFELFTDFITSLSGLLNVRDFTPRWSIVVLV